MSILTVKVRKAGDEQFKLLEVKDADQVFWDELVEALKEGIDLFLDGAVESVLGHLLDVIPLVVVSERDFLATRDEFDLLSLTEIVLLHRHGGFQACDVVLEAPFEVVVVSVVEVFQVGN